MPLRMLTYSPMVFIFAAFMKYADAIALRTCVVKDGGEKQMSTERHTLHRDVFARLSL